MNKLALSLFVFLSVYSFVTKAQEDVDEPDKRGAYDHYIGVQGTQIVRAMFAGGNISVLLNPYILTYAVNSRQNGIGIATGIGFNYVKSTQTTATYKSRSISWRLGLEKKTKFGKRFIAGYGADFVLDSDMSSDPSNQSPYVITSTGVGGGPRITALFTISEKFLIGTEASAYFSSIKETARYVSNSQTVYPDIKTTTFAVTAPASVFLVLKL